VPWEVLRALTEGVLDFGEKFKWTQRIRDDRGPGGRARDFLVVEAPEQENSVQEAPVVEVSMQDTHVPVASAPPLLGQTANVGPLRAEKVQEEATASFHEPGDERGATDPEFPLMNDGEGESTALQDEKDKGDGELGESEGNVQVPELRQLHQEQSKEAPAPKEGSLLEKYTGDTALFTRFESTRDILGITSVLYRMPKSTNGSVVKNLFSAATQINVFNMQNDSESW
jgi:hypothetical protein